MLQDDGSREREGCSEADGKDEDRGLSVRKGLGNRLHILKVFISQES